MQYLAYVINKSRAKGLAFIVPKKSKAGFCNKQAAPHDMKIEKYIKVTFIQYTLLFPTNIPSARCGKEQDKQGQYHHFQLP